MGSIFDEPERNSFDEFRREQAREAMNDREVGLVGMAQAASEYKRLSRELGYETDKEK